MKEENQKSLYVPELEHDSCGTGFVAHLKGKKSHQIVEDAITMLENMEHRGACGCDPESGDGAGICCKCLILFSKKNVLSLGLPFLNLENMG
jgi:glutamate synthase (NADPH/NADH) large chain